MKNEKIWQTPLGSYNVFFHKFCKFSCFSVWEMHYTVRRVRMTLKIRSPL